MTPTPISNKAAEDALSKGHDAGLFKDMQILETSLATVTAERDSLRAELAAANTTIGDLRENKANNNKYLVLAKQELEEAQHTIRDITEQLTFAKNERNQFLGELSTATAYTLEVEQLLVKIGNEKLALTTENAALVARSAKWQECAETLASVLRRSKQHYDAPAALAALKKGDS